MNRQSTSSTLNKIILNGDHRAGDLFNEHTASDPEFYNSTGNHGFDDDLYDFNTINQANLEQRAPNSSDEEEDGA